MCYLVHTIVYILLQIYSYGFSFSSAIIRKARGSRPEVFLRKGVLKICSKFTGEHPCWSVVSIKLERNFTEIALQHGCFPVNLLHIFGTPFPWNTSGPGWLLLKSILFSSFFSTFSKYVLFPVCGWWWRPFSGHQTFKGLQDNRCIKPRTILLTATSF